MEKEKFKQRKWDKQTIELVKVVIGNLNKKNPMNWDKFYKGSLLSYVMDNKTFEDAKLLAALERPYLLPYLYDVKTFEKAGNSYITRMGKTAYITTADGKFTCYGCGVFEQPEFYHLISKKGKPEAKLEKLLKGADALVLSHHNSGEETCGTKHQAEAIAKKYGIKKVHCHYFNSEHYAKDYRRQQEKEQKRQK